VSQKPPRLTVNDADLLFPPELLLNAYAQGFFPMAESREGDHWWFAPDERGVIPLESFRVSRNLARLVRRNKFEVRFDSAFEQVIRSCADRSDTWISVDIEMAYIRLHERGFAHSVECWMDDEMVGGLYGVALCGAFFGESMFHHETDASKVALVHLVNRLRAGGYVLLDTQYLTSHLEQFGGVSIPRENYLHLLEEAMAVEAHW
jgi:leucyl/phenylalanyl-tRNA---protein transferase